jgi:phenylacetate-coenzyme A ligase PaaK-like adenylate-forming protein
MHVPENRLFLNFVDPKTLDPVSKEEKGVDLISTLYDVGEKPAVILLGYSHGDLGRILDSTGCNCSRTYKQMEWPVFRNDYIVKIAGQNTYPVMGTEAAIVDSPFLTGEYTSITREFSESSIRPYLEIRVEKRGPIPETERKKLEQKIWTYVISNPGAEGIVNSNADFVLKFTERGCLYEDLEKYVKPGKPIRLIRM